jgi:hypothetical protein
VAVEVVVVEVMEERVAAEDAPSGASGSGGGDGLGLADGVELKTA